MFIGSTLCVEILTALFSINSQELFKAAVTEFITGIAAMHDVLVHSLQQSLACSGKFHMLLEF
jgi:hypothetical protein